MKPEGYEFHKWEGHFPQVITIFSAPNYEHLENNGAVMISWASGGFDVRTFGENEEQMSIYEGNKDMITLMQPRMNHLIFKMLNAVLNYGNNQFAPGIAKTLSNKDKIDWDYLNRVIAACGGKDQEKPKKEKKGLNINFKGKGGSRRGSTHSNHSGASGHKDLKGSIHSDD